MGDARKAPRRTKQHPYHDLIATCDALVATHTTAEIVEYGRTSGDAPGNKLTIKSVNDHQWAVTFRNQQNQIVLQDTWTVSADNSDYRVVAVPQPRYPPEPDALALASLCLDGLDDLTPELVESLDA